ncbi:MAG: DinB family protein [Candidatus Rokubacteria bacterium]|nr:DinB family protein [Candidatus Rokubacteria bacterium]
MTDEQQRIRSYLQVQGAKLSPADVIDKVRAAMRDLRAAAEAVPAARFDETPAPDEWSANQVMAHVLDAGRHFGDQIVAVLDGVPRSDAARATPAGERRTAGAWCARLDQDRAALFERVLRADPAARLDATIEHGMFGPLSWRETLLFMRLHDLDHVGQLKQIAAALAARPA